MSKSFEGMLYHVPLVLKVIINFRITQEVMVELNNKLKHITIKYE